MDTYDLSLATIPLSYARPINGVLQTGLTVTVGVSNAKTGATLLASTPAPEISTGAGIYTYNWSHGLNQDTTALVTYTIGTKKVQEFILLTSASGGSAR